MIEKPTVLILGAGASEPYGFPTGGELQDEIIDGCQREDSPIWGHLSKLEFDSLEIQDFGKQLLFAKRPSVDRFLESRETPYLRIGTAAIVSALIPKEEPSIVSKYRNRDGYNAEEDWYKYLWMRMDAPFEQFENNKLSIITYNYDRSLEFYLLSALKHAYGKTDEECFRTMRRIPVIHLHGQLGTIFDGPADSNYRAYLPDTSYSAWKKVIPQIKIVHQVNPVDNPQFMVARKRLFDAERICFLGFGYDRKNVERLFGGFDIDFFLSKTFCGTALGFTLEEMNRIIMTRLGRGFNAINCGNLELLRQTGVLL